MQDSRISLPPLVDGPERGALRLSLGALSWAEAAPAHLRQRGTNVAARVAWWGDASGGDLLPLPPPAAAAAAGLSFQLRTGPKYLTRYLRDMGALTITIEAAPGSKGDGSSSSAPPAADAGEADAAQPLATATVGLLALDVQAPSSGTYPLVLIAGADAAAADSSSDGTAAAAIVGSLDVQLELDYNSGGGTTALVSSFEMNEHLASSAAGADAEAATDSGSGADGSSSHGSSSEGDAAAAAEPAGLCEQLVAALQDRWVLPCMGGDERCGWSCTPQPVPFTLTDLLGSLLAAGSWWPQPCCSWQAVVLRQTRRRLCRKRCRCRRSRWLAACCRCCSHPPVSSSCTTWLPCSSHSTAAAAAAAAPGMASRPPPSHRSSWQQLLQRALWLSASWPASPQQKRCRTCARLLRHWPAAHWTWRRLSRQPTGSSCPWPSW